MEARIVPRPGENRLPYAGLSASSGYALLCLLGTPGRGLLALRASRITGQVYVASMTHLLQSPSIIDSTNLWLCEFGVPLC